MSAHAVTEIANAVLYEGFILYPYRPSAIKNRQRWTFGGVFPQTYSMQTGSDPWALQTECLVQASSVPDMTVQLRFLHVVEREVQQFVGQAGEEANETSWHAVEALAIDEREYVSWDEAIERDIEFHATALQNEPTDPRRLGFAFPASSEREVLRDKSGRIAGALLRRRHALDGVILVSSVVAAPGLVRLRVRVENSTSLFQDECTSRAVAQRAAFASTHAILRLANALFVSSIDPPAEFASAARATMNEGWWPVLVGDEGAHDTMLAAPIILYDYPKIAPESPGDLFDGTEIDEILTLRILTMTDAEKREAAAADPRIRTLLERTEALTADDMARLHGILRAPAAWPAARAALYVGSRVRIRPKPGGDVMDIVLSGRIAIVEAVERDFENRVHVAVTIEDDPGREFGMDRFPGHRFFFSSEELELIGAEATP